MNEVDYKELLKAIENLELNIGLSEDLEELDALKKECLALKKKLVSVKKEALITDLNIYNKLLGLLKKNKELLLKVKEKKDNLLKQQLLSIKKTQFNNHKFELIDELKINLDRSLDNNSKIEIFKNTINSKDSNNIEYLKYILENLKNEKYYEIHKQQIFEENNVEIFKLIEKEIDFIKNEIKISKNTCQNSKEITNIYVNLTEKQKNILAIMDNIHFENYEISDLIMVLNGMISSDKCLDNKSCIDELFKYLSTELVSYMSDNKDYQLGLKLLLNNLKIRIKDFDKTDKNRNYFKTIYKKFKELNDIYKDFNTKEKISPYFSMIMYFLQNEINYLYIKKLIKMHHEIVNIRYNNKHIIFYILEEYFKNFEKMVKDRNSDYININYLREVYLLFLTNSSLRLTTEEKEALDLKINDFLERCKNTLIKEKRKKAVEEDLKDMRSTEMYQIPPAYKVFEMTDDILGYESNCVIQNLKTCHENEIVEKAFVYGNRAFKLAREKDMVTLTMYSIDLSNYILRKSLLGAYLYNCELIAEKVDNFTTDCLRFRENEKYPAFAHKITFNKDGNIKKYSLSKETIFINKIYSYNSNDEEINLLRKLNNIVVSKNGGKTSEYDLYIINKNFEDLINKEFIKFINQEKLPYLYYGKILFDEKEVERKLFDLSSELYKLNKSDSRDVKHILGAEIDEKHYSVYPIPNANYELKLFEPFTFLGLETQRMLNDLYFNQRKYDDEKRLMKLKNQYSRLYHKLAYKINEANNYVDPIELEKSRGRIRKIYKKDID